MTSTEGPFSAATCSLAWDRLAGPLLACWLPFPTVDSVVSQRCTLGPESHPHELLVAPRLSGAVGSCPLQGLPWGPHPTLHHPEDGEASDSPFPPVQVSVWHPGPPHPQLVCLSRVFVTKVAHSSGLAPGGAWGCRSGQALTAGGRAVLQRGPPPGDRGGPVWEQRLRVQPLGGGARGAAGGLVAAAVSVRPTPSFPGWGVPGHPRGFLFSTGF